MEWDTGTPAEFDVTDPRLMDPDQGPKVRLSHASRGPAGPDRSSKGPGDRCDEAFHIAVDVGRPMSDGADLGGPAMPWSVAHDDESYIGDLPDH